MSENDQYRLIPRGWFVVGGMFIGVFAVISLFFPSKLSALGIVFSAIVTWTILLTPPVVIRLLRKVPFDNGAAIFICIPLYFVYHVVFSALGSQSKSHTAIVLGTFAAYYILRRSAEQQLPKSGSSPLPSDSADHETNTERGWGKK